MGDKSFSDRCLVTSYNNFISDHNSIVLRMGLIGNEFTADFKSKVNFDSESHMKGKFVEEECSETSSTCSDYSSSSLDSSLSSQNNAEIEVEAITSFSRKFRNIDMSSCWLNSCLQLVLIAMDHHPSPDFLTSELGLELRQLQTNNENVSLESTNVKHILVASEDTRIATLLSELVVEVNNPDEYDRRVKAINETRLDLISGQQCVRDFFICLKENVESWPDVFSCFGFQLTHTTNCIACNHTNQHETTQMCIELDVPPDNHELTQSIDDFLNTSSLVGMVCENQCQRFVQKEKSSILTSTAETEFLLVILNRVTETMDGYHLNPNRTISTQDVYIR